MTDFPPRAPGVQAKPIARLEILSSVGAIVEAGTAFSTGCGSRPKVYDRAIWRDDFPVSKSKLSWRLFSSTQGVWAS